MDSVFDLQREKESQHMGNHSKVCPWSLRSQVDIEKGLIRE